MKGENACDESKKDAPAVCDTEFMNESHALVPPMIPAFPRISRRNFSVNK